MHYGTTLAYVLNEFLPLYLMWARFTNNAHISDHFLSPGHLVGDDWYIGYLLYDDQHPRSVRIRHETDWGNFGVSPNNNFISGSARWFQNSWQTRSSKLPMQITNSERKRREDSLYDIMRKLLLYFLEVHNTV